MGPAAIPIAMYIAAGASVAATGYGIYAGERARSDAARQYRESKAQAEQARRDELAQLQADKVAMRELEEKQRAEQTATETRLRQEQEGTLARVRGEVPGMQQQLGEDLLKQQEYAYKRMAPQMESRLNALGLLQSGSLPEAQAKAQGDLEAQRQAALADFGTSARRELNIDRPLAYSSEDVGRQYEGMKGNLETARSNLAQTFANQNAASMNQAAREQYLAGLESAQTAAAQQSANAYLQFGGQLGSGLISAYGDKAKGMKPRNASLDALYDMRRSGGWSGKGGYNAYA